MEEIRGLDSDGCSIGWVWVGLQCHTQLPGFHVKKAID